MNISLLVIISVTLLSWCSCKALNTTNPSLSSTSSCGHINNIRCPFRLKGDDQKCGDFSYELYCDNNRTLLKFNFNPGWFKSLSPKSYIYFVKDINYDTNSIRVVDPGLDKDNNSCFALPLQSFPDTCSDYFATVRKLNTPITFIDCSAPAISNLYVDTAPCSWSSSVKVNGRSNHSYVVIGGMDWSDVEENCTLMETTWVSSQWQLINTTTTFRNIHENEMHRYGFEIPWTYLSCLNCVANGGDCDQGDYLCRYYSPYDPCDLHYLPYGFQVELPCGLKYNLVAFGTWFIRRRSNIGKIFGIVCAARFFCGLLFLLALIVYKLRRRHLSVYESIEDFLQAQIHLMPVRYNYSKIKKITNSFKDKLGEGGFGTVYKGKLQSGLLVAVKMLGNSKASGQEFINEVATIGRIHHVNVVRLVGFCFEGSKRALIYELMPNGSLEKYIFPLEEDEGITTLSCQKMFEISFKVAGGIEYLHRGCDMQILHFDIKPHNILLDENFNPKISDFGLAKLYATDDSIVTLTAARGTMGYMAPELFYKNIGGVSYKADVYSFGMLLMEMAGRRKNLNPFVENTSQIYFPLWIYDQFNEGKEIEMEDASAEEKKLVKKMVIVALWCIQMKPGDRPSMNKVIEMLEGDVENLIMPPKPFLCPQEARIEDQGVE